MTQANKDQANKDQANKDQAKVFLLKSNANEESKKQYSVNVRIYDTKNKLVYFDNAHNSNAVKTKLAKAFKDFDDNVSVLVDNAVFLQSASVLQNKLQDVKKQRTEIIAKCHDYLITIKRTAFNVSKIDTSQFDKIRKIETK
jgi:hypothetical protein